MGNYFSKNSVISISILIPKYNEVDQSPPICLKKYSVQESYELPHCFDKNCPNKHIQNNDKFLFEKYMK